METLNSGETIEAISLAAQQLGAIATRVLDDVDARRREASDDEVVAVLPVVPRRVAVRSWYELGDDPWAEMVGVAVTRSGVTRPIVCADHPQVLDPHDLVAADVPAWWRQQTERSA